MSGLLGTAPDCPSITEVGGAVWSSDLFNPRMFNPSIGANRGQYAITVRKSNYVIDPLTGRYSVFGNSAIVKNKTYFSLLSDNLSPIGWREVEYVGGPLLRRGPEDARLLSRGGVWYLLVVLLEKEIPKARLGLYRYDPVRSKAEFVELYDGPKPNKPEKNWVTKAESDAFKFDYVTDIGNNVRGGTMAVRYGEGYISIGHRTYYKTSMTYNPMAFGYVESVIRTYTHVLVEYDLNMVPRKISKEFKFENKNIEFAAGLVQIDERFVVSFGVNDSESKFASIPITAVPSLMEEK